MFDKHLIEIPATLDGDFIPNAPYVVCNNILFADRKVKQGKTMDCRKEMTAEIRRSFTSENEVLGQFRK